MISPKNAMALQQIWMRVAGPQVTCDIIHPGSYCAIQIIKKCATVVKQSSRLYLILYITIFMLKIKKIRQNGKWVKSLQDFVKDFLGSLAFMSWLVGGMKAGLCILNNLNLPLDIRITPFLSLVGSPSIYFIPKSRRSEVSYFVLVRALRSSYIFLKKRTHLPLTSEKTLCFVLIFGIVSYLFYEGPTNLKHRDLIDSLWGEA